MRGAVSMALAYNQVNNCGIRRNVLIKRVLISLVRINLNFSFFSHSSPEQVTPSYEAMLS